MNKSLPKTGIPYADRAWHICTGCSGEKAEGYTGKGISEGCQNCWAFTLANRFSKIYGKNFKHKVYIERLTQPWNTKDPSLVFISPMGDITNLNGSDEWEVEGVIDGSPHLYLQLSKHPKGFDQHISGLPNVWTGVSVESPKYLSRLDDIPWEAQSPSGRRWLSIEPYIERIPIEELEARKDLFEWVVIGGEQGTKVRLIERDWFIPIWEFCQKYNKAFFFKQWGKDGTNYKHQFGTNINTAQLQLMNINQLGIYDNDPEQYSKYSKFAQIEQTRQFPIAFAEHFEKQGIMDKTIGKLKIPLKS